MPKGVSDWPQRTETKYSFNSSQVEIIALGVTSRLRHPRSARLLSGNQFKAVFNQRRVIANEQFRIHYADVDAHTSQPRLGMAISKRICPKAVGRNRIRRQIRESFRLHRPFLAALDFVVLAKPAAAQSSKAELQQALNQLWQRFRAG